MVGVGQKKGLHGRDSSGGSLYSGMEEEESFPEVPYSKFDFNDYRCNRNIGDYDWSSNPANIRNCRLVGLLDLDQGKEYVRGKIVGYLNHLIDLGVAGFRIDASKHMWPGDLKEILFATKNLKKEEANVFSAYTQIFGSNKRPFVVHEVIDKGGDAIKCEEYTGMGRYTNFNYGPVVSAAAKGALDWANLRYLKQGYSYGNIADNDVLNFIDNHDNQRGDEVLNYKHGDQYKRAVAFMLAWPYGYPRVMSSFYFHNNDQGPPSAGPKGGYETKSPWFDEDLTCNPSSGWVCEHRWPTTREMVKFRSAVAGTSVSEVITEQMRLAFAREGKGFFAVNGNGESWKRTFQTSLPSGQYCDVWSGYLKDGKCTGKTIIVNKHGSAEIDVSDVVAISLASKVGSGPDTPTLPPGPKPTTTPLPASFKKTVIMVTKDTTVGQYMFLRGGTSHAHGGKCLPGPHQQEDDDCAIPIKHNTTAASFSEYKAWSYNDNYLDFQGAEYYQGLHNGGRAYGTPLIWSTNEQADPSYQKYNKYGPGFWLVELMMDCSKTDDGWFEFKGFLMPKIGWEPDTRHGACAGSLGGSVPFKSNNHVAKCGAVNVFSWGSNLCVIEAI
ncbi:alpha amylase, catalytic domain protein [Oesophagostomum dentatum]|uniref:alpha-amylase n=1 Tax=Oesophagostomum dentatum TaxID=61180 RepID=A0A0B1TNK1_OESDE|nr:alpha amylase, catalytic domain protein [Oesophagostomum dentatum]